MKASSNPEEKFWSLVQEEVNGCWVWLGARSKYGYGDFFNRGRVRAHRFSFALHLGVSVDQLNGVVCHKCDNTSCVNPDHLFLGTQKDNMQDCLKKGRFKLAPRREGSAHHAAKLTEEKVLEIFRLKDLGRHSSEIAGIFGVHRRTVDRIVKGLWWKHVNPDCPCGKAKP